MTARTRVSIVIPSYNLGRFVGEAIDSALTQTHPAAEVLVVDDGSTDDSVEVIRRHPVRLVRRPNGGVARTRNQGAREAVGDALVFLDADDVLEPTYVERCLEALEASPPTVAYAYTKMQLFGTENRIFDAHPFDRKRLLEANFVNASAMVRREPFERVGGFNPAWGLGYEDHELWVRMLSRGYTGVLVPEPLLRYRRHGPSRNTLSREQLDRLRWKLIISQPRLYWREIGRAPVRALRSVVDEVRGRDARR